MRLFSLAVICSLLALPAYAQKRQSESELDGLRGAVKTVTVERADLKSSSGKLIESAPRLSIATTYDVNGDRVIEKKYDEAGRLIRTHSYSNADGYRVMSDESFGDGNGHILRIPLPGGDGRHLVLKYMAKYKYKYDGSGNVSEESVYAADDSLVRRHVYRIVGNRKEILTYLVDGSPGDLLNDREVYIYDKKGDELEAALYYHEDDKPALRQTYQYVEFDDRGNWKKRIVTRKIQRRRRVIKSSVVEYRRITYY